MFSLIITIVSIALVVALVAATMYHGGDTLTQGRTTAEAAAFVSGAQQIGGAQVMHLSLEGAEAAAVADLVTAKYLASAPVVKTTTTGQWLLDTANDLVTIPVASAEVCQAINKAAGLDVSADPYVVPTALADNQAYGCVNVSDVNTFQFKY